MGLTLTLTLDPGLWFEMAGINENEVPHEWLLGSRETGPHCPDCLSLAGEVRTLGEWMNSVMPGAPCLQCGSGCRCSLQSTLSLPTSYNLFLPFGTGGGLNRALVFKDGSRLWRYDFTEVLHGSRPSAVRPGRAPAASLPTALAAERRVDRQIDRPRRGGSVW
jgi:hypothetical protein